MTSGGNGSRLAKRSSSAFSLSLWRLDGLVFSLEGVGFLMRTRSIDDPQWKCVCACVWTEVMFSAVNKYIFPLDGLPADIRSASADS